jgi:hypothetical protein
VEREVGPAPRSGEISRRQQLLAASSMPKLHFLESKPLFFIINRTGNISQPIILLKLARTAASSPQPFFPPNRPFILLENDRFFIALTMTIFFATKA